MSKGERYCLAKIKQGHMQIVGEGIGITVAVFIKRPYKTDGRWIRKIPDVHPKSGRYRYRFTQQRSTVYRSRLIWMVTHKRPIPLGYVVDHKNEINTDDRPCNLRLMPTKLSERRGGHIRADKVLKEICDWFEFVGGNYE